MIRAPGTDRPRKKGILVIGFLLLSAALAAGTLVAFVGSGNSSSMSTPTRDPLGPAKILIADGDSAGAESLLRSLLAADKENFRIRLLLGRVLMERGHIKEAQGLFNALHKEKPDSVEVVLGLGRIHERLGEMHLAITCFRRATEMKKDDPRIWRELGLAQEKSGDTMAALFTIRQSLKLDPSQEDLSRLLNDLGTSRQAHLGLPQARRGSNPFDSYDPMDPRPPNPMDLIENHEIPNPTRGIPRPGARPR